MKKFLRGFVYAFRGIIKAFEGQNMKFHGVVSLLVILASWYYQLSIIEWIIVLILIGLVLTIETINSSIEELNNTVKKINKLDYGATTDSRNLAAGSVLIIAFMAAIIGLIIFIPKVFGYF